MISIVLVGASGRMGKAIEAAAARTTDLCLKARVDLPRSDSGSARPGAGAVALDTREPLASVLAAGDVAIEFSSPAGCQEAARACAERGACLVSGTTGLSPDDESALESASRRVPVLRAANFSIGVLSLRRALAAALDSLPEDWDIEIVERHHRAKADSPSGTALMLAREAAAHRGISPTALRHGREGRLGARPPDEIGVHAVRGGSWAGDHEVLLAGSGEWIELRHVVQDRSAFAEGALAAARFLVKAAPGLYTLEDVRTTQRRNG